MSVGIEFASSASPVRSGWLSSREAGGLYVAYERKFKQDYERRLGQVVSDSDPEGHSRLARYAAFPFIVSPELVNLIRINFLGDRAIPWVAEADFLLSPLCRSAGDGLYQVDPGAREVMLRDFFKQEEDPGRTLLRLADFLLAYSEGQLAARYPADVWAAWRWIALSYLQPDAAVKEMTAYLRKRAGTGAGGAMRIAIEEQLQVAMVLEMVRTPIENLLLPEHYRDLMDSAHIVAHYWYRGADVLAEAAAAEIAPGSLLETITGVLRAAAQPPSAEAGPSTTAEVSLTAILTQLRDALADLYWSARDVHRVVTMAGLTPAQLAQIPFSGSALDMWTAALPVVRRAGKLTDLTRVVNEASPGAGQFTRVATEYQAWVEQHGEPDSGPEPVPEPPWEPALAALRDTLADLYWDGDNAVRVASDAGLPIAQIAVRPKPAENWRAIVEEAHRLDKVRDLIAVARNEHPQNQALGDAEQAYLRWAGETAATPGKPTQPSKGGLAPESFQELLTVIVSLPQASDPSWRRRILLDAGFLRPEMFDLSGPSTLVWSSIIRYAEQMAVLPALIEVLLGYYPDNAKLTEISLELEMESPAPSLDQAVARAKAGEIPAALTIAREIDDLTGRGDALVAVGRVLSEAGDTRRARRAFDEAIAAGKGVSDPAEKARYLIQLAPAIAAAGDRGRAGNVLKQASADLRRIQVPARRADLLLDLGQAYADVGDTRAAINCYEQALITGSELGDRRSEGTALGNLGNAYTALGEVQRSVAYYEQALAISRELGDPAGESTHLGNLGNAHAALGEVRQAVACYEQVLAISQKLGDRRGAGTALGNLGNAYAAQGEARRAIEYYEQSLAISAGLGDRVGEGTALGNLGNAYAALGEVRRAIEYYEQALAISREIGDRAGESRHLGNLGHAYADLGDVRRAIEFHEEALAVSRELGDHRGEGTALGNLGNAYLQLGDAQAAIGYTEQALAISREIGDAEMARRAEGQLAALTTSSQSKAQDKTSAATTEAYTYDVFISYSHADQDWVWNWLIPRLKAEGLILRTDQESFEIGVPSLVNMENAVLASRYTLLVLTPAYVNSQWTLYEQILTQTQDLIGQRQRILPVLREPCELPPRIAMLTYVDLREGVNADGQVRRLINAIRGSRALPDPQRVPVGRTPAPTTAAAAAAATPAPSSQPVPSPTWDTAAVRELLMAAFTDEELTTFCYDNFRPVYEEFTTGMSRTQKVQRLVETCERRGEMEKLLVQVERMNAYQYARFRDRLRNTHSSATSSPNPSRLSNPLPPNPFSGAVTGGDTAHFVGRKAELRRLRTMLAAGPVVLVGPPKIGKSSLLRQLALTWKGKVIGPINWLELENTADFFAQLARALGLDKDADLRAIRDALRKEEALLLVDELDAASARGMTHDDLALFRGVTASNPRLKLVVVSHRPLKEVFPDTGLGSPAYNVFVPLTIGVLSDADSRQLLAHPWAPEARQFDPATLDELLKLADGHPFKLQRVAFHRYESMIDPTYDWQAAYQHDLEHML